MRDILDEVRRLIRPLVVRVANSIARGAVQLVDDGTKLQLLQLGVLQGEDLDECERFQEYGFTSVPHKGAEAVVIFPNGDRGHALVVAVDDLRYRPTAAQPGEVILYTDEGDEIRLARGNVIVLKTAGEIRLGSAAAADPVALKSDIDAIRSAIETAQPVANDGGAALRSGILSRWPDEVGATKVKAE